MSLTAEILGQLASIPSPSSNALNIGPLSLHMYGIAIAVGVFAGVVIARRRIEAWGGDPEDVTTIAIIAVPAGLIGARVYHVITDWQLYNNDKWYEAFFIWKGGLGIPGGILFGAVAGIITAKRMHLDWRVLADAAAPAIPISQAIGRIGNWFNQELYGRPTDLPWALEIADPAGYPPGTTFHPTFLYEGLWNVGVSILIVVLGRSFILRKGRWFAVYVIGYGLGRLWVESLRIDSANEIFGLRVNTWISLIAIAAGLLWLFWGGSPIDREATDELRDGETDPRAHWARRANLEDADETSNTDTETATSAEQPLAVGALAGDTAAKEDGETAMSTESPRDPMSTNNDDGDTTA